MSLKYVSLHNHTNFSMYDGLGYPKDFYNFVIGNGGDAFAITDHGSMNSLGYAVSAAKDFKNKGVNFKPIYGVEAYIVPSIAEWHKLHSQEDVDNDIVIENESESKGKWYDPIKRRHHLVLFALNNKGLQNLFTLVTLSYRKENFYRFPRMDFDMLRQYSDGIGMSTACVAGLPSWLSLQNPDAPVENVMSLYDRELKPLLDIFGKDRAFLELQFNALSEQKISNLHMIEYAKRTGYDLIVASDAHYCRPDLWREREIYKSLGRQMKKMDVDMNDIPKSVSDLKCELYPHNAEQIYGAYETYFKEHFQDEKLIKSAINRTHDIAWQLIDFVQPDSSNKLPRFIPVSEKIKTPFDQLKHFCSEEMKRKNLQNNKTYVERLVYELKIIKDKNISEYFLSTKDILDLLRKYMLLGVARGSGGGSLVNYLLGITIIDPIEHGLIFERFISPSRAELPDIDNDVELKDESFDILKKHFGEDNVLAVSNYNTLQLKSLVKDIARLYDIPFEEVNECTKVMEIEAKDQIMEEIGHDQKLYEFTYEKAKKYSPTFQNFIEKYPQVGECIDNLFKAVKAIGRHAGGVLVVPDAHKHLPVIRVRGVAQSPFSEGITAQHLKLFGLIKFDVLGLTTLKIIRRCIENILKNQGNTSPTIEDVWQFYNTFLHPSLIDQKDQKVFKKVYHDGKFPSIFQFAESAVQNFCTRAKPTNVSDISAITALWRPGPLQGNADQKYLENSDCEIQYDHPVLEEVLGNTRGCLLFQEQFMYLANKLAGFSFDEADKLRKLLVKPAKELGEEMKQQRQEAGEKFIAGCIEKGLTPKRATDLWEKEIQGFISYGFNKSLLFSEKITIYSKEGKKIKDKQICDIEPGEYLKSRDETTKQDLFIKVIDRHDHGVLDLVEIELDNGKKVKCTLDHKFRTIDGRMLPLWMIMEENLDIVA